MQRVFHSGPRSHISGWNLTIDEEMRDGHHFSFVSSCQSQVPELSAGMIRHATRLSAPPFQGVRCARFGFSVGATPTRQLVVPAGSSLSGGRRQRIHREASASKGREKRLSERAGRNLSERRVSSENGPCGGRPSALKGKADVVSEMTTAPHHPAGVMDDSTHGEEIQQHKRSNAVGGGLQPANP